MAQFAPMAIGALTTLQQQQQQRSALQAQNDAAQAQAAALEADSCEILSDVDGIYTADPRFIKEAQRLDVVDYDLALEMSAAGAQITKENFL